MSDWDNAEVKYHPASGLWYKFVRFSNGERHVLCSGDRKSLEKESVTGHTHFWERNGSWYSQERFEDRHLMKRDTPLGLSGRDLDRMMDNIWAWLQS